MQSDFKKDRLRPTVNGTPSRVTYMAHGKGYVMCRHPGCIPFVIREEEWLSFPIIERGINGGWHLTAPADASK